MNLIIQILRIEVSCASTINAQQLINDLDMHLLIIHASILKLSTCETNALMTRHIFYTADLQYIPQHLAAALWSFASTINRSASTSSLLASARTQFCQFGGPTKQRREQANRLTQFLPTGNFDR